MISLLRTKSHIGKLFIGALIFFGVFLLTETASAATLSLSPNTGVYTTGGTFTARVLINTAGKPINAAEGSLSFDPQQLAVVGISKGSIFNLWTVEPAYSNSAGTITFGGGSPSGYSGSAGTVMSVTFRAKAAGTARVNFRDGSVLAADGLGTNVLTSMSGGTYTLAAAESTPEPEVIEYIAPPNTPAAPVITSSTHEDPAGWSTETVATLSWSLPAGITAVRTLLDKNSGTVPTKVYEPAIDTITLEDLEEGVQYFHLQFRNADGWGRVAHYRLAVDTSNPSAFLIEPIENADLSNPAQTFKLNVTDEESGIAYFAVQIDGGEVFEYRDETGSSTITLPELEPGQHSLIIEAFDYAGNSLIATKSFAILAFDKPQFTEYPSDLPAEIIPVIKGITKPNAEVTILLTQGNTEPKEYKVSSNADGIFTFIPENRLAEGVYELQAVAIDEYGAKSEPSDIIKIAVQQPGYIRIGSLAISILSLVVPAIGLVVLLILLIAFGVARLRSITTSVRKETKDALSILEKEFESIRKTLSAESDKVTKSRKTKKLTKAETHLIEQMDKSLQDAEENIKKEIAEVDDIVE